MPLSNTTHLYHTISKHQINPTIQIHISISARSLVGKRHKSTSTKDRRQHVIAGVCAPGPLSLTAEAQCIHSKATLGHRLQQRMTFWQSCHSTSGQSCSDDTACGRWGEGKLAGGGCFDGNVPN
ncbi:hypothetical protein JTE90_010668 [Oedothorax gibbosus]|uniref:Uncharacterized protein n=1 Tax=Oedothorax gibbosus TaxID=931172 RepID=A0AAV6USM5_9ARAC|nr:hypothetical protein JTE90_010668 [Oedothorax gibbosus]